MLIYSMREIYFVSEESDVKKKSAFFRYCPVHVLVLFILALVMVVINIISRNNPDFADGVNDSIGRVFRWVMTAVTGIVPFSLTETIVLCIPLYIAIVVLLIVWLCKNIDKFNRVISSIVTVFLVVFIIAQGTSGSSYYGKTLAEKMGMKVEKLSAQDLYDTGVILADRAAAELDKIVFPENTYSIMPFDYSGLNDELNKAWDKVVEKYDFYQKMTTKVKPVMLSFAWTYTHISGMYFGLTGEANINTNYPDYVVVSSAAHESAHQRGIGSEDEANFTEFLVCINSDNPYLRYSGYMDMLHELLSKLSSADATLNKQLRSYMDSRLMNEYVAYGEFFAKYATNVAAKVSDKVNDINIVSHGQPEGVKSYGMVVDLVCAYLLHYESTQN